MQEDEETALSRIVRERLDAGTSRQVAAIGGTVKAFAAQVAGQDADDCVAAVLAYGSCLRDVSPEEGLADFYVLTADDAPVSSNGLSRLGCRLVPPNVYYAECVHEGKTLRAKYAVLPLAQFEERVSVKTKNPYFWARFSQPSVLTHVQDENARERVSNAIETALNTMLHNALALCGPGDDAEELWITALAHTYETELRSEGPGRGRSIIAADQDWYLNTAEAVLGADLSAVVKKQSNRQWAKERANWKRRRTTGKALSVARLLKAAFTFKGGADYLAWKIERHSGVEVSLSPWQRRHPILAAVWLYPKLKLQGAFR
ncbi:MAG: hypothetical protein ACR2OR_11215 [Hyphomicrobiales bacterium]